MSFWIEKKLSQMSATEWEALCDGCGKCCLNKIIDDDTNELFYTNACCKLLDQETCHCQNYQQRFQLVPECTAISIDNIAELTWLPDTCAYRRLYLGKSLPVWHPLLCGSSEKMHQLGMSVMGKTICETRVNELENHIVSWPLNVID